MESQKSTSPEESSNETDYPGIAYRAKAASIDGILLIVFLALLNSIISSFNRVPDGFKIAGFLFVFVFYDPLFTCFTGGTIGHKLMGIRVKKLNNEESNINFFVAVIRFLIKAFLGWISLLSVNMNPKKQALHDQFVRSIVLFK
ncbi:MAG: RDD family protein [Bacteroidetes bacterium]|nr:MAG: RDD family protein [Bacteroidota bacterium]